MTPGTVECGFAARTFRGQTVSGDRHLVMRLPGGVLLAVADGLGHGAEAARASELAVRTVERHAGEALAEIVLRCHRRLRPTRGVALTLALWDYREGALIWLGVGNVEGLVVRARRGAPSERLRLVLRGGIVGSRLPPLQTDTVPMPAGGILILATDGIAADFDEEVDLSDEPQPLADRILASRSRDSDDALVLVGRIAA